MYCRPEYDMRQIGRNLRRLRERKNLTVEQVREYLCLGTVQAVYKYETGKSYPQTDTMFALMELYDADLYDVIGESNELSPISFFRRVKLLQIPELLIIVILKINPERLAHSKSSFQCFSKVICNSI